jgi:hypothetical protein
VVLAPVVGLTVPNGWLAGHGDGPPAAGWLYVTVVAPAGLVVVAVMVAVWLAARGVLGLAASARVLGGDKLITTGVADLVPSGAAMVAFIVSVALAASGPAGAT